MVSESKDVILNLAQSTEAKSKPSKVVKFSEYGGTEEIVTPKPLMKVRS